MNTISNKLRQLKLNSVSLNNKSTALTPTTHNSSSADIAGFAVGTDFTITSRVTMIEN